MTITMKLLFPVLVTCFVAGCELPDKGVIETPPPPLIIQATPSPSTLDVNHLASQPTDPVDTTILLFASVNNLNAETSVAYTIFDPDGNFFMTGPLADDGVYPDQVAGDGTLSAAAHFHIQKKDVGMYLVQFQAKSSEGYTSNTVIQSLTVKNSNNHPPSLSNLIMPDTVAVPPSGDTTFVRITVAVSDSEGLGDIVSVKLTAKKPNGASAGQFYLYDDGGTVLYYQFGGPLASGDSVAKDGIYTITIPLTVPGEPPPTYRDFSFSATDRSGDSSNTLTQRIYIVQ